MVLHGLSVGVSKVSELADNIRVAFRAREALHSDPATTAYRLFHGFSEGGNGLTIDRYGEVAVVESRGGDSEEFSIARAVLSELADFSCIVGKMRGQAPRALLGELPSGPATILEEGLNYSVETWAVRNPGLYLDARPARRWLCDHSAGRRVLNLFSHAGSLGVAAMAGGAKSVIHVDTQKRALSRCRENHQLNGYRLDSRDLQRIEVDKALRLAIAAGRRFGGIIVDPPPPGAFASPENRLPTCMSLAPLLAKVAESGSWILCFFHHDARSWDQLEGEMARALARPCTPCWRGRSGLDFPEPSPERDLRLCAMEMA